MEPSEFTTRTLEQGVERTLFGGYGLWLRYCTVDFDISVNDIILVPAKTPFILLYFNNNQLPTTEPTRIRHNIEQLYHALSKLSREIRLWAESGSPLPEDTQLIGFTNIEMATFLGKHFGFSLYKTNPNVIAKVNRHLEFIIDSLSNGFAQHPKWGECFVYNSWNTTKPHIDEYIQRVGRHFNK